MRVAEPLSLLASGAAERAFTNESFVRRLAKVAQLKAGANVLQLGLGDGSLGLALAEQLSCRVTVVAPDLSALDALNQKAAAKSLGERYTTRVGDLAKWRESTGFQLVLVTGGAPWGFVAGARQLRDLLGKDGRIGWLNPVRVGLGQSTQSWTDAWQEQLGEPFLGPSGWMRLLEQNGYEPEGMETLSESELAEALRARPPLERERALFETAKGDAYASCAVIIARRREQNEKPSSGDRG